MGEVFGALDELDERLGETRFLSGDTFTWLDLRLFKTLVRFDPVYAVYFKCTTKRIADYPNVRHAAALRALWALWVTVDHGSNRQCVAAPTTVLSHSHGCC